MERETKGNGKVVTTTEARQASPRKLNFRVLVVSLIIAVAVGVVLYAGFLNRDF